MNDTERALDRAHDALRDAYTAARRQPHLAYLAPAMEHVYEQVATLMAAAQRARVARQPQVIIGLVNRGDRLVVTGWTVATTLFHHFRVQLGQGRRPFTRHDLTSSVDVAAPTLPMTSDAQLQLWLDSIGEPSAVQRPRVLLIPVDLADNTADSAAAVQNLLDLHRQRTGDTVVVFTEPRVRGGATDWVYWPEAMVIGRRDETSTTSIRLAQGRSPRHTFVDLPEVVRIGHDGNLLGTS